MRVIRGRRVVLPEGERAAAIHIAGGRIVTIAGIDDVPRDAEVIDAGDLLVLPGGIDTHVHVNEPGRTDWEGFDTATRAAAAGGSTTIVDMPLNSIPATVDVPALEQKRDAARGRCHVDVAFWGGIVPGSERHILPLVERGVRGFKIFLTPSGVEEFAAVGESDLRRALPELARASRDAHVPLLVHAEDPARLLPPGGDPRVYATFLETRPVAAEVAAIELIARLAAEYHVASHIVHVTSADAIAVVAAARNRGVLLTAETCPHYLTFAAEDVPRAATAFKCAPPIRSFRHRDALWAALRQGSCDLVASDHSPAPPAMKAVESGDFLEAWGGIASLQVARAAVWTGARDRGFSALDVSRWMAERPAHLCGLGDRKGAIRVGYDADLVLFDGDARWTVKGETLQHRHKLTPYEGRELRGIVRNTYLRGELIWDDRGLVAPQRGQLL